MAKQKVMRRKSDGVILPYAKQLLNHPNLEVAEIDVPDKSAPKKKRRQPAAKTDVSTIEVTTAVSEPSLDEIVAGLDDGEDSR